MIRFLSAILLILFTASSVFPVEVSANSALNTAYGSKPSPPDPAEKKALAELIAIYFRLKNVVVFANRCYNTYKGINDTYHQIDYFLEHFNDYWENVYNTYKTGTDNLVSGLKGLRDAAQNGDVMSMISSYDVVVAGLAGYEQCFFKINDYFAFDVTYLKYTVTGTLSQATTLIENPFYGALNRWGASDYEKSYQVISNFYDNTKNMRSLLDGSDPVEKKDKRRALFEWNCFITAQAMKMCGDVTKDLDSIMQSIKTYQELGTGLQTEGEQLAYTRFLTMGHLDMDYLEFMIAVKEIEIQKHMLLRENITMYNEIGNRAFDPISYENLITHDVVCDPFEYDPSLSNDPNLAQKMYVVRDAGHQP